jgi:hypothetical protein
MELKFHIPESEFQYFRQRIKLADKIVQDRARKQVETSAYRINFYAKRACPVVTGRLRGSIRVDFTPDHLNASIGSNVRYGPHAHEHARDPDRRYFLERAFKMELPKFISNMKLLLQ